MATISYLMFITSTKQNAEVLLAILNTAGLGQEFHSSTTGSVNKGLWIIPKGKKSSKEIISQLKEVPGIRNVSVVTLSRPINETELDEVRKLLAYFDWDTSSVTDNELVLFINDKLQGQYTYFIDYDHKKIGRDPVKILIKPIQEHPYFSPDLLKENIHLEDELPDRELTIDDIEIRHGILVLPPGKRKKKASK